MKAIGHLFWDILGSWFLASCAISVWLLMVVIISPLHSTLFKVVPADGPVTLTQRIDLDNSITSYLVDGNVEHIQTLTQTEQAHLFEVRQVLIGVVIKLLLSLIFLVAAYRHVDSHSTRGALAIVSLLALLSATVFEQVFTGMHKILFTTSQWILPSVDFQLTQVYPENFFVFAWGGILSLSLSTIGVAHAVLRRKPHATSS